MNPTIRDYYFDDTCSGKATILQLTPNESGGTVILDRTIFVPQGGGQPADSGVIGNTSVTHVEAPKELPDIIVHSVASVDGLAVGTEVNLRVDGSRRQLHSRLHTGGHLIAALVEQIALGARPCGGHHWPGEGRVEFIFESGTIPDTFEQELKVAIDMAIDANLSIRKKLSIEEIRYVQIADYPALRCGGSHCINLKEIGGIILRGSKLKKGRLRVGYDVTDGIVVSKGE